MDSFSGYSTQTAITARAVAAICATRNMGTERGAMPAKVSLIVRASVTAGFAKLVEDVNQYAAVMYAPTANGATDARPERTTPNTTSSSPKVAIPSPSQSPLPVRALVDQSTAGSENMRLASSVPTTAPATCAMT